MKKYLTRFLLVAASLSLQIASAQSPQLNLGDVNGDGAVTIQDVAVLQAHLNELSELSTTTQQLLADATQDGVLNESDTNLMIRQILELRLNEMLPLGKVRSSSPSTGESGVSLTRESIVHFTVPLAAGTVLDTTKFWAEFAGKTILSRVELATDRTKATLFYLEPLPSAARVHLNFDSTGISDDLGRSFDANGDGVSGGRFEATFDTASITPIPGTAVVGQVFASERATGGADTPLAGVTITVDGAEETLRAVTGPDGRFTLNPAPAGTFFVHIDGRTSPLSSFPNGSYYPFVGKKWFAQAGRLDNPAGDYDDTETGGGTGVIYLPCVCAGTLQPVSMTQETQITFPASVLAANPALAGTSLAVPPNALFADDGTRGGRIGIAPVAPDRLPGPFPSTTLPAMIFTVQSDGPSNFDRPVPVCWPNLPDPVTGQRKPAGSKSALLSFNHDSGEWEMVGPMTVTADGNFVKSDAGVGIIQPGWHGDLPFVKVEGDLAVDVKDDCPGFNDLLGPLKDAGLAALECTEELTGFDKYIELLMALIEQGTAAYNMTTEIMAFLNGQDRSNAAQLESLLSAAQSLKAVVTGIVGAASEADPSSKIQGAINCLAAIAQSLKSLCDAFEGKEHCHQLINIYSNLVCDWIDGVTDKINTLKDAVDLLADLKESALKAAGCYLLEKAIEELQERRQQQGEPGGATPLTPSEEEDLRRRIEENNRSAGNMREEQGALEGIEASGESLESTTANGLSFLMDQVPFADVPPSSATRYRYSGSNGDPWFQSTRGDGSVGSDGKWKILVPANGIFSISFYNPALRWGGGDGGKTPGPGSTLSRPRQIVTESKFPPVPDTDNDGLSDAAEEVMGTNPNSADSDGDGASDAAEALAGLNPRDGFRVGAGQMAAIPISNGSASDVSVMNNVAALALGSGGVGIFSVGNGPNVVRAAELRTIGAARAVAVGTAFVAVASDDVEIIDVRDMRSVRTHAVIDVDSLATAVAVNGPVAYAGTMEGLLLEIDMDSGALLRRTFLTGGSIEDLSVGKEVLYVLQGQNVKVVPLGTPTFAASASVALSVMQGTSTLRRRLVAGERYGYVVAGTRVQPLDLAAPALPIAMPSFGTGSVQVGQSSSLIPWNDLALTGTGSAVAGTSTSLRPLGTGADGSTLSINGEVATSGVPLAVELFNGVTYAAAGTQGLLIARHLAIDVAAAAPTISLNAGFNLASNAVEEGKLVRVSAAVTDDVQLARVEFYINGALAVTDGNFPFEARFVTPAMAPGQSTFTLSARAVDTGGNATSTQELTITLLPDSTPPFVISSYPPAGGTFLTVPAAFATLNEAMDRTLGAGIRIVQAGADGQFNTADDVLIAGESEWRQDVLTWFYQPAAALAPGSYAMIVGPPLADASGNAISSTIISPFRIARPNDTDNDGLPDDFEILAGTNPNLADTNGNGVPDGREDRDGDGLANAGEVAQGSGINTADTDGDGTSDGVEDSDMDGLNNGQEFLNGSNFSLSDTDGDGFDDASEVAGGTSPLLSTSQPFLPVFARTAAVLNAALPPAPATAERYSPPASFLNAALPPLPPLLQRVPHAAAPNVTYRNTQP